MSKFAFLLLTVIYAPWLLAQPASEDFQVEDFVTDLEYPWSLAFISARHMLVTERVGRLRQIINQQLSQPVTGLPSDIYVKSQGGLLDVKLHPNYRDNGWLYLSYASGTDKRNRLKVIRAKLKDNHLFDLQEIFTVSPDKDTPVHFGGRMVFLHDNSLLISTGDGFDYREDAQRINNQLGKMIRVMADGSLPKNNPYIGETEKNLSAYVFSLGHRNPQGLVYDKQRDVILSHEHGPAGGDEINVIRAGRNYGWPVITQGKDYSGATISPFTEYRGMQQPLVNWTPSIAPSGMAIYHGILFPQMRGDVLISTLKAKSLRWLKWQGNQLQEQTPLFTQLQHRFRDVKVGPDGAIYLLVDSAKGKIIKVTPKQPD